MTVSSSYSSRSFDDWLCFLEQQHPREIDMGLARIAQVAKQGQLDKPQAKVITVAGTNGKGSSCALLEQILIKAGYRVGVYSSPHLLTYRERVRINGELPNEAEFCRGFEAVAQLQKGISLSYFEYATLTALYLFEQAKLDYIILEVGLGGRLDATNIVDADVAVVTTIALDHIDWLGDDIQQIGREKAGIFRANQRVVIAEPEIVTSVPETAANLACQVMHAGRDYQIIQQAETWEYRGKQVYQDLPLPVLPINNAAGVLAVIDHLDLNLPADLVRDGIANWQLAGRLQVIQQQPMIMVDVAHNPQSAEYLAKALAKYQKDYEIHALCSMLADKDIGLSLSHLKDVVQHWHIAELGIKRGASVAQLAAALATEHQSYDSVSDAFQQITATQTKDQLLLVFGSFFTVAAVLDLQLTD